MPSLPDDEGTARLGERAVGEGTDGFSVSSAPHGQGSQVLVTASGDVDHESAHVLGACLQTHLSAVPITEITLDLTGIQFLGAAGLAVLARAQQLAAARGVRMVVRCGSWQRTLFRLLAYTGLDEALTIAVVETA